LQRRQRIPSPAPVNISEPSYRLLPVRHSPLWDSARAVYRLLRPIPREILRKSSNDKKRVAVDVSRLLRTSSYRFARWMRTPL
jgi:hypothetical protein